MDAKNVSEILMNDDSEFSNFSSSGEEYDDDDLDLHDSSDSDSHSGTNQISIKPPVGNPGPSQLRAM